MHAFTENLEIAHINNMQYYYIEESLYIDIGNLPFPFCCVFVYSPPMRLKFKSSHTK